MITTETPPTGGTPGGAQDRRSYKLAKIVIPAFLLVAVFTFTGAPTAMTVTVLSSKAVLANNTVFANNITTFWDPPPCRGDKPGVCPYFYQLDQPGRQTLDPSTGNPNEQATTHESPTP